MGIVVLPRCNGLWCIRREATHSVANPSKTHFVACLMLPCAGSFFRQPAWRSPMSSGVVVPGFQDCGNRKWLAILHGAALASFGAILGGQSGCRRTQSESAEAIPARLPLSPAGVQQSARRDDAGLLYSWVLKSTC